MAKNQFDPYKYSDLFDNWDDSVFKAHREDELKLIKAIPNIKNRTVIDLGAGYGRTEVSICNLVNKVIAIEIDKNMHQGLTENVKALNNVETILGDIIQLTDVLKGRKLIQPVMLMLENTLGSIEGNWKSVVKELKNFSKVHSAELILSLYRKQALPGWGLESYWYGKEMNGEPDMERTDFDKGLFVSKTGYVSKWWGDDVVEDIRNMLEMETLSEIIKYEYWVMYLGSNNS